jgi:Single-strand binding protein family
MPILTWSSWTAGSSVRPSAWCYQNKPFGTTGLNAFSAYDDDEYLYEQSEGRASEEELTNEELEATMGEWDERVPRFNTIHLTGRIGSDPEPRYFDDGKVVVNVSLATKSKYHSLERQALQIRSGEEETDWYGLEIWVSGDRLAFVFVADDCYIFRAKKQNLLPSLWIKVPGSVLLDSYKLTLGQTRRQGCHGNV